MDLYCEKCGTYIGRVDKLPDHAFCKDCFGTMMQNIFEELRPKDDVGRLRVSRWVRFWRWLK